MSYFLEQERDSNSSAHLMQAIEGSRTKVLELIMEGLQNPVVASALHQHSEDYVTILVCLINSVGISKQVDPDTLVGQAFLDTVTATV